MRQHRDQYARAGQYQVTSAAAPERKGSSAILVLVGRPYRAQFGKIVNDAVHIITLVSAFIAGRHRQLALGFAIPGNDGSDLGACLSPIDGSWCPPLIFGDLLPNHSKTLSPHGLLRLFESRAASGSD